MKKFKLLAVIMVLAMTMIMFTGCFDGTGTSSSSVTSGSSSTSSSSGTSASSGTSGSSASTGSSGSSTSSGSSSSSSSGTVSSSDICKQVYDYALKNQNYDDLDGVTGKRSLSRTSVYRDAGDTCLVGVDVTFYEGDEPCDGQLDIYWYNKNTGQIKFIDSFQDGPGDGEIDMKTGEYDDPYSSSYSSSSSSSSSSGSSESSSTTSNTSTLSDSELCNMLEQYLTDDGFDVSSVEVEFDSGDLVTMTAYTFGAGTYPRIGTFQIDRTTGTGYEYDLATESTNGPLINLK